MMKKSITISCEEISMSIKSSFRGKMNVNIDIDVDNILDAIEDNEYILRHLLRYYTGEKLIELINNLT